MLAYAYVSVADSISKVVSDWTLIKYTIFFIRYFNFIMKFYINKYIFNIFFKICPTGGFIWVMYLTKIRPLKVFPEYIRTNVANMFQKKVIVKQNVFV